MKIAHFSVGAYFKGGTSNYVMSLADLQIKAGDEVLLFETIATSPPQGGLPTILVRDENELFERCKALRVDILHYHTGPRLVAPADIPVVCTIHEHSPHCISGGLFLKRSGMPCPRSYSLAGCGYGHIRDRCGSIRPNKFFSNLHRLKSQMRILPDVTVISVGEFLKKKMLASGYPGQNIFVVPNFTPSQPADLAMPASAPAEFLYIGRLEKLKGVEWLVRAFANTASPASLTICGQGDAQAKMKALVDELGIADRIRFVGWIDGVTKTELLRTARAVIAPSIWPEPFGLVAIEAGAAARPVIVSDSGELPFIIENGKNGIVVKVGDVAALTVAIDALNNDFAKAQMMGMNNREKYLGNYTPEKHKRMIDAIYEEAREKTYRRTTA